MPQKHQASPTQLDDAIELYLEVVRASDSPERKYYVSIILNQVQYVYFVDATSHEEALQIALREFKASPYAQVGTATCFVYGLCNDRTCNCGHLARLIKAFATL
jgi:hypothetical protein